MSYKVGDKVKVIDGKFIPSKIDWQKSMNQMIGNTYEIVGIDENFVRLALPEFWMDTKWIEPAEKDEPAEQNEPIKRGDIGQAMFDLMQNDEMVSDITDKMPILVLVLGAVAIKLEDVLFGEEE